MVFTVERINKPLEYERYIKLQNSLRVKKKELLLLCEHSSTITAGVQFDYKNLLSNAEELKSLNIKFIKVARGGDITAHEPGQCIIYPHVDLKKRNIQLSHFFKTIMDITSRNLLRIWNIETIYKNDYPGLYLLSGEKIASIGISFKSFFTSHGIAVNISNNLETFKHIIPCGMNDVSMTSVSMLKKDLNLVTLFVEHWIKDFQEYLKSPPPSHMHS